MEYTHQSDQVTIYQSNFRAEDGATTGRSNALYVGVVVPLASLFAVVLFVAVLALTVLQLITRRWWVYEGSA